MDFIPQIEPWIDENELRHLTRLVENKYVVENQLTKEFEDLVKNHTGSKHAISVTNGTMALYCCLVALGIGQGDEVIVPNLTFIATANSVIMAGAKPVFCDVDFDTMCLDTTLIEKYINDKTKAIIPVHLYGESVNINKIKDICNKHNISLIEDAAQGVGVLYNGRHVGTFGDFGILSYYGNKTITCGEGGIILTNDDELAKKCYRLKNHGRDKKGIFIHEHIGFNFSFTEMQAAIGISQMEKLDRIIEKKKLIHDTYLNELSGIDDFIPQKFSDYTTPVHWFTSFLTSKKRELSEFLLSKNIQTRDFFYPLSLQPCYNIRDDNSYNNSIKLYNMGISLPSSYNLTIEQQSYIIDCIKKFYNE
jgi:perosamine synthetase